MIDGLYRVMSPRTKIKNSPQLTPLNATLFAGLAVTLVFALTSFWQFALCEATLCQFIDFDMSRSQSEHWYVIAMATAAAAATLLVLCPLALRTISERNRALEEVKRQSAALQESLSKELKQQNERFNLALENLSQGVCMFDGEQRLIISNNLYASMYDLPADLIQPGVTLRQILEYRIANGFFAEGSPEAYINERMTWVTSGKSSVKTQQLTDGRIIEIVHQPMSDGGWLTTHEDISERRKSSNLLRAMIDSFPGGIAAYDANLELQMANKNYYRLLDIPDGKFPIGTHVEKIARFNSENGLYGPGESEELARTRVAYLQRFERYSLEGAGPDGTILEFHGYPLPENSGFVSTCLDITERRRVEESLKQSGELFTKAFQKSPIPLTISRPDGAIYDVNEAWLKTVGYTREETIGNSALKLQIWANPNHRAAFVAQLDQKGIVTDYEAQYRTKSGELREMLISGEYVEVGGEPHMFNLSHDVTKSKKAKQELVDHRDKLQLLVNEATAELKSKAERLESALEKEKKLNELQRQFVSTASHEFRTPLAVIDGLVQRLVRKKDDISPEELEVRATKIRRAVRTITNLMESTLSAARMDAGKAEINITNCDIHSVIAEACEQQRQIGVTHNIVCDLANLPKNIEADAASLNQVFTNLLSNASKYSSADTDIEVNGWLAGEDAMVSIRDSGLGIDEDDLPKMFTRFFRAKTSTGIPGTGIGLNLVQTLVELHKGSVSVESTKGVGSTFVIRLPVKTQINNENHKTRAA